MSTKTHSPRPVWRWSTSGCILVIGLIVVNSFLMMPTLMLRLSGTVTGQPTSEAQPVSDNADSTAIEIHPAEPLQSIIKGTAKKNGLAAYNFARETLQVPLDGNMNNAVVSLDGTPATPLTLDQDPRIRTSVPTGDTIAKSSLINTAGIGFNLGDFTITTTSPAKFEPFGTVTLPPDFDLDGQGTNVDSIAFWEAPVPADTLMFVTAKKNQLVEVWKYPFENNEQTPIRGVFGSGKVNGIVLDQETDLLYVSQAKDSSTVYVFAVSSTEPHWQLQETLRGPSLGSEPNQDILYHDSGETWFYVTDSKTGINIWNVDPISNGAPPVFKRNFTAQGPSTIETILADDYYQIIYVPDENGATGVYAYDPDGTVLTTRPDGKSGNVFGEEDFEADEEGILLYTCPSAGGSDSGTGLIVVADQKNDQTDFEIFNRQTWEHLGTLRIEGVSNTDGIASSQQSLPNFPLGIFSAINDDTSTAGIGWEKVLNATGLKCGIM